MSIVSGAPPSRSRRSSGASGLKPASISSNGNDAERHVSILESTTIPESELLAVARTSSVHPPIMRSRSSSEDEVQISLGIQEGIERAWKTALAKVGSISLAWQNEAAVAHVDPSSNVDPCNVFDGVRRLDSTPQPGSTAASALTQSAQTHSGNDHPLGSTHSSHRRGRIKAAARPRSISTVSVLSSSRSVRSDSHAVASARHLDSHPDDTLKPVANDGGFSDHATEARRGRDRRKSRPMAMAKRPKTRVGTPLLSAAAVGTETPQPVPAAPETPMSAERPRPLRRHRMSIKLNRLLPPKTPEIGKARHSRSLSRDFPAQVPLDGRSNRTASMSPSWKRRPAPSSPISDVKNSRSNVVVLHRRSSSLPQIDTIDTLPPPRNPEPGTAHGGLLFTGISEGRPSPAPESLAASRQLRQSGQTSRASLAPIAELLPGMQEDSESYHVSAADVAHGPQTPDESRLTSLEEQVSMMLDELGLHSPRRDSARAFGRNSHERNSDRTFQHGPGIVPWFHQPQFTPVAEEPKVGREVTLVDDDSSCADNAVESDYYRTRLLLQEAAAGYSASGSSTARRHTGTSAVSTGEGSVGSTAFESMHHRPAPGQRAPGQRWPPGAGMHVGRSSPAYQPRISAMVCSSCRDQKLPCSQMHIILERLEQTDMYVKNVARHASAVDALLADLRAQSRVLAETLSISQARASSLSQTVADAIDNAKVSINSGEAEPPLWHIAASDKPVSSIGTRSRLGDYRKLSKRAHNLDMKAQLMLSEADLPDTPEDGRKFRLERDSKSHLYSWIKDAVAISAQATSASDSEFAPKHPSIRRTAEASQSCLLKPQPDGHHRADALSSRASSTSKPSRKPKKSKHRSGQQHRPVQPISVRVQRISSQWAELCGAIDALNIGEQKDAAATGTDNTTATVNNEPAADIAADGLKLIQRVLKTTLESLERAKGQSSRIAGLDNTTPATTLASIPT
ncbi:hypothetical protein GQ54DRAFT_205317 [Martensiomyces pterosporus]|nr:hypothetical protein GQ54DRAFT_205317 [Martensiomyces pterosporus]